MAEDAKTGEAKTTKRGRKKAAEKIVESQPTVEAEAIIEPAPTPTMPSAIRAKKDKAQTTAEFQESVREQIENARSEIITELQVTIQHEISEVMVRQAQKERRKRRWNAFIHDLIILILLALVGYMGFCLYDAEYFDFLPKKCERDNSCQEIKDSGNNVSEIVKDTAWYKENYGYLFDGLQLNLDPDGLDAHYLYSGDYRAGDIKPAYLLAMAYNRVAPTLGNNEISVSEDALKYAFIEVFGSLDNYARGNFRNSCLDFSYERSEGRYVAADTSCSTQGGRQILEQIDEIYEEGNALYFLTTATIYDPSEESFYTFDNPFRAAVTNVTKDDLNRNQARLNRYQYQFKKTDGQYYFDAIVKLK